ncbi:MAG: AAA family ATPase [archaeon]|jgi:exonuclease SbcC
MINSLTLRNWRTHKETTLEFGKGTNVIVGVMGAGKSSIVNAISYSLFGTFPSLKNRSVSLAEIIMNKPNQENKAETIITFDQNEKNYKVERIIKLDGTNEAKMYESDTLNAGAGRLIAGPKQKDVNEKVEQILGLNYELFSRAVYSEQNELDFFLKLSPAERKRKFDELLEIEKYETARKNAVVVQNELVKANKQRNDFINQQKETLKSHEEEKLHKQIVEEENQIKKLEIEIEETTKSLAGVEKEYLELNEKEKQNKTLEELVVKVNSRIEGLKEDISKSDKISLKEVLLEIEKGKKEVETLKEKLANAEKEYKTIDLELKKNSEELRVIEYEKQKIAQEEKGISSLKGTCPTCKQILDENHKNHLTKELTEKLEKLNAQYVAFDKSKKELKQKIELVEKEKENFKKESDNKSRELFKFEAMQKEAILSEEKKKQLASFVEELPKIKKQLTENGFDKKKLETIRDELYKKKSIVSVAQVKIKSSLDLKKSYEITLQKIVQIKKNIIEIEKETLRSEEAAKKMGILGNCLIATQVELRESMLQTINQAMSQIWGQLYPYKDFTDARLCIVDEGYDLQVLARTNGWVRVEGVLSGGERSAAALCIRIAFSLVLTKKLSMLILDEPTHNLDSNSVAKLSEILREELPKLVEQIFVITHDKQLEMAASSNLYLLTRDKDVDESTRAESIQTY